MSLLLAYFTKPVGKPNLMIRYAWKTWNSKLHNEIDLPLSNVSTTSSKQEHRLGLHDLFSMMKA